MTDQQQFQMQLFAKTVLALYFGEQITGIYQIYPPKTIQNDKGDVIRVDVDLGMNIGSDKKESQKYFVFLWQEPVPEVSENMRWMCKIGDAVSEESQTFPIPFFVH